MHISVYKEKFNPYSNNEVYPQNFEWKFSSKLGTNISQQVALMMVFHNFIYLSKVKNS